MYYIHTYIYTHTHTHIYIYIYIIYIGGHELEVFPGVSVANWKIPKLTSLRVICFFSEMC